MKSVAASIVSGVWCLVLIMWLLPPALSLAQSAGERGNQTPANPGIVTEAPGDPAKTAGSSEQVDEVVCVAGCRGKPPETVFRRDNPAEKVMAAADLNSPWRQVTQNVWCRDGGGCRSVDVILPRPQQCCEHSRRPTAVFIVEY